MYTEKIQNFEAEANEMQEEFESAIQEYEAKLAEANYELSTEGGKAKNYWTELEQLRAKSSKQSELYQAEVKLLEESISVTKEQARIKEEEILQLKQQEKHTRDRALRLEEKMIEMEKEFEEIEMDRALVADELNQKLVEASDKHARLEEEKSTIRNESRKNIESLESQISKLESVQAKIKKDLASRNEQLSDRDKLISTLRDEKMVQEQTVESWKVDLDKLICAYDKCKLENAARVKKLQGEYAEFKQQTQQQAEMFQKDYDTLQDLAQRTEEKLEEKNAELFKLKDALEDKKRTIADMIDCQRLSDQEIKEAKEVINELHDISESLSRQNDEWKNRFNSLTVQMENELNKKMDEIDRKDKEQKEVEFKMKKMDKEIQELKELVKTTDGLKAENFLLQDKVDRQAAYLKRKLEKEHKQRMNPNTPNSPPPRTNLPRSRSVSRRTNDPISSQSQSSTRQPVTSDDELEDLLN
jgi:chromosome segregation ATPase